MGAETALAIGVATLLGGAAFGMSEYSNAQSRKAAKSLASAQSTNTDTGNLTSEEATASASKRMFRQGLYFTSPTGVSNQGSRGRSRLFGS